MRIRLQISIALLWWYQIMTTKALQIFIRDLLSSQNKILAIVGPLKTDFHRFQNVKKQSLLNASSSRQA